MPATTVAAGATDGEVMVPVVADKLVVEEATMAVELTVVTLPVAVADKTEVIHSVIVISSRNNMETRGRSPYG